MCTKPAVFSVIICGCGSKWLTGRLRTRPNPEFVLTFVRLFFEGILWFSNSVSSSGYDLVRRWRRWALVTFQILLSRRRAAQLDFLPSWGNQQAPPLKVNPSLASFAKNLHIRAKARPGSVPLRIVKDLQKVQNPEQPMYSVPKVMLPRSLTLAEMR